MRRVLLATTVLLGVALTPSPGVVAAPLHDVINFVPRSGRYIAFENGGVVSTQLQRCCHGLSEATVEVVTQAGAATPGVDYSETQKTVRFVSGNQDNDASIPVLNDITEEPVETFDAHLQSPTGGATLGFPNDASVFIVDDDGAPRISFILGADSVFENRITLDVTAVRSGDPSVPVSVQWSTVDGTAIAGQDYEAAGGSIEFAATERRKTFRVSTINDSAAEGNETFSLALTDPSGATLVDPASLEVTIADDETPSSDTEPPVTAFHQPLHDRTYRARDLTDILVFADDADSGVKQVHIALRKKMRSGACKWYVKKTRSFQRGPCTDKTWIRLPGAETVIYPLRDRLAPSTRGARVRFYKAWSRGVDELGNVETAFRRSRNVSRFDIR
jgi:hypothetical protein